MLLIRNVFSGFFLFRLLRIRVNNLYYLQPSLKSPVDFSNLNERTLNLKRTFPAGIHTMKNDNALVCMLMSCCLKSIGGSPTELTSML